MTRVDFYVLPGSNPRDRWLTACRLIEKAWRQGHVIFLRTGSEEETRTLDDLLWTFRQGSFVPHEVHPAADPEVPVLIGHGVPPATLDDLLVNLAGDLPPDYGRFRRIAELVDQDETVKQAGRRRYRVYQGEGHALDVHEIQP